MTPTLPRGSLLSVEPGGQLELSTLPAVDIAAAVRALQADQQILAATLRTEGYGLAHLGLDPARPPERVNPAARYVVMEDYFDRSGAGPVGRLLMSSSAGLQLNLEAGPPDGWAARLARINRLAPVLAAMSACSARSATTAAPSAAASLRQQAWFDLEPQRTEPVSFADDPASAWSDYALAAPLMQLRDAAGAVAAAPQALTFAGWVRDPGRVGRAPTGADLDYHLTTLFPVVRPRGFLELRFLDASPGRFWPGLAAIVATLVDDPAAAQSVDTILRDGHPDWAVATNTGVHDPELRRLATACAALAVQHCPVDLRDEAEAYAELVSAGRSPGELLLDEAGRDGWRLLEEALDA
jgi:glutamate--cysteine ligase